ncbi:MAG: cellulase family glycosylhydrolase, partial [Catenulispora sp.]|nr:cellulase family glycosylhydrolase [Catenulispora sp.]
MPNHSQARPQPTTASSVLNRLIRFAIVCALATLVIVPASGWPGAAPAHADTGLDAGQYHGLVWSQWSERDDNYCDCDLLLDGLSTTDTYATVQPKTAAIVAQFQSLGVNTIRIPINYKTATDPWWNTYRGVIDQATAQGVNIILSYWTEGHDAGYSVGLDPANLSTVATSNFGKMWTAAVNTYQNNPRVYFDPMNEPHAYSATDWLNIAATWIADNSAVPRNRMLIPGVRYDEDVTPLCNDSRFAGTYLALHKYWFFGGGTSYDSWVKDFNSSIGQCASRTIVEEFGSPVDLNTHLDFNDAASTDNRVAFLRAMTDTIRKENLGAIWCHGVGGRNTYTDGIGAYDELNILRNNSNTGSVTPFWTPNLSALERVKYAWGEGWDNLPERQAANAGVLQGGARLEPHSGAWNGQNVGYMVNVGDGVTFQNLSASPLLDVDYAAAASGTFSVYVNGVKNQSVSFPSTGDWGTFATKTVHVTVPAGASITLRNDSGDTAVNVDYIQQRGAMTVRQGATVGQLRGGARVEPHSGAWNGQNVGYMVNVGDGVTYSNLGVSDRLDIGFAAAASGTFSLYVNGVKSQSVAFTATGDWGTFTEKTVSV